MPCRPTTRARPLALIEAAAAGRPAVATAVGGVGDVVKDGVTGLLAPATDEQMLADAMFRLASDPDLRSRLGAAAPSAADGFGIERLVDDLERIYKKSAGLALSAPGVDLSGRSRVVLDRGCNRARPSRSSA